jgi:hypothetical protein
MQTPLLLLYSISPALPQQTLIKIMTGELKASSGIVWRHPNLRMAYVAQHAFHHLEEHLDISPVAYMFKRFGLGLDQVGGWEGSGFRMWKEGLEIA